MTIGKLNTSTLVLLSVLLLAACKTQVETVQQRFPSDWETYVSSEGTSFENRIAWAWEEAAYAKDRLFLDSELREGQRNSDRLPVLRMRKPYGCEVDGIDVAVDDQRFEVEVLDHYTDLIITPPVENEHVSGSNASRDALLESWGSAPFWQAFTSGEEISLSLSWDCEHSESMASQYGTQARFSLTGADYALYYVAGGRS